MFTVSRFPDGGLVLQCEDEAGAEVDFIFALGAMCDEDPDFIKQKAILENIAEVMNKSIVEKSRNV